MVKQHQGYTVYSDGRIKANGLRKVFLKGYDCGYGYLYVKLNGKNYSIHKIIAECFIGKRPKGYTINHIDGNKLNNDYSNLEYITREENYKHALDNNLKRNLGYYITAEQATELIEFYYNTDATLREIANNYGFDKGVISRLIAGKYTYDFKKSK